MSDPKTQEKNRKQLSILGFIDQPDSTTGKGRAPRSRSKKSELQYKLTGRKSSSKDSSSVKRKATCPNIMEPEEKRHNMEDNDTQDPISGSKTGSSPGTPPNPPKNSPKKPEDAFTKALKEMEDRLTANMNNMKSMIEPLQTSIDTLLGSQAEWESHKQKVTQLEEERKVLNQQVSEVEKKNATLETRIKKLENKLMECNIIVHGVKEVTWEPDSTRRELVVQTLANTVKGTEDKKLEIARRIPLTSTKQLGRYNPLKPHPICISFACKSDADMLLEWKKIT